LRRRGEVTKKAGRKGRKEGHVPTHALDEKKKVFECGGVRGKEGKGRTTSIRKTHRLGDLAGKSGN